MANPISVTKFFSDPDLFGNLKLYQEHLIALDQLQYNPRRYMDISKGRPRSGKSTVGNAALIKFIYDWAHDPNVPYSGTMVAASQDPGSRHMVFTNDIKMFAGKDFNKIMCRPCSNQLGYVFESTVKPITLRVMFIKDDPIHLLGVTSIIGGWVDAGQDLLFRKNLLSRMKRNSATRDQLFILT